MRKYLGIGIGPEDDSLSDELLSQGEIIIDDAVMDQRQPVIIAEVGVGV